MSKTFELCYSTQKTGFEKGRAYSNPRFFNGNPRAGITKVIVVGSWPNVVSAYKRAGVPVEVVNAPRMAGEDPKPMPTKRPEDAPRSDAPIPDNWRDLAWLEKRLLAQNFSTVPVINSQEADLIIGSELARRKADSAMQQEDSDAKKAEIQVASGAGSSVSATDEAMREAIKAATGRYPHPATSRDKLEAQYREIQVPKPEPRIAAGGGSSSGGAQ